MLKILPNITCVSIIRFVFFSIWILALLAPFVFILCVNYLYEDFLVTQTVDITRIVWWQFFASREGISAFLRSIYILILPPILYYLVHLVSKRRKIQRIFLYGIFGLLSFYYIVYFFLLLYKLRTRFGFDFNFFWYNREVVIETLKRTYAFGIAVLLLLLVVFPFIWIYGLNFLSKFLDTKKQKRIFILLLGLLFVSWNVQWILPSHARGEMTDFVIRTFFRDEKIAKLYQEFFWKHVDERANSSFPIEEREDTSLGKRVFFLEFESLSSYIADKKVIPHYLSAASEGIFFPKFYTTSVQTIRGQESFLCGLPPTLTLTLVQSKPITYLEKLPCLPRIMKNLGYKTIFFKSDDLSFANTDVFMKAIGFDELHSQDIMRPDDPTLTWGYREDVFFKRVFEYLERYSDEKLFVFIAVSSTNHWPFDAPYGNHEYELPYKNPNGIKQIISNSAFLQDVYFKTFYDIYQEHYAADSTLIITSDQSWPMNLHPNNLFNESGAYEENFLIPFTVIPPKTKRDLYRVGSIVEERYSQSDVLPTIIKLLGTSTRDSRFIGTSFDHHIIKDALPEKIQKTKKLSIQPYNGGFISLVEYPKKYLYSLSGGTVEMFDLQNDPDEKNPLFQLPADDYLNFIDEYFSP